MAQTEEKASSATMAEPGSASVWMMPQEVQVWDALLSHEDQHLLCKSVYRLTKTRSWVRLGQDEVAAEFLAITLTC